MLTVWRITRAKWVTSCFSGAGAATNPGRWNSLGRKVVYCAESRALAALEILVNVEGDKSILSKADFLAVPVSIEEKLIARPTRFPADWKVVPPTDSTRHFGDRFLGTAEFPVLRVPSAVVIGEFNYLLNPAHRAFTQLTIGEPVAFSFDPRALR